MEGYSRTPDRDDTDVVGPRVVAQIIDSLIVVVLAYVPMIVIGFAGAAGGGGGSAFASVGGLVILVGVLAALFYMFALEGVWDGRTVGKSVMGIKVVKENGGECTVGSSILRNLLEIVDGFFYYAVGLVFMAMSDKRQRLGDRVAGTVVVKEE